MTEEQLTEVEASELIGSLLHKEGHWVDWGKACQKLQKAGYNSQTIFEATGFQSSQQNLIIVAAQVYESISNAGVSEEVLTYFLGPRSDVLYELRILNQEQRAKTALLVMAKALAADATKEVAKAVQEMSHLSQLPPGFTNHPGDAIAYQSWKRARQKKDLQERSRLIAQGLKFAHSASAREAIEKLLSDFSVAPTASAPLLPLYRLEAEEQLPRPIPVAGTLPLTGEDIVKVPSLCLSEPFGTVKIPADTHLVSIPGWQTVLQAVDPVVIFTESDLLPQVLSSSSETVLVLVDRHLTSWNIHSYFLVAQADKLSIGWFETAPNLHIFGQVILILRPKKILDEDNLSQPWQMDD
ncbi:hypothetical protein GLO73106DRAFT_00010110 [Gloeocapsa sp. PCC 73106]|nr:RuBisCO accumulation factor 1 [Gloeocapsa sp. PCC 73106]ELR97206.1 hypothetical protein GLO73106DRAFT_00010110 [Gloeocapsa sp. PCC 73106]